MRAHPVTKALLAGALCLGLSLWRASADTPTGTTSAGPTSAAQTPAGAPQPSSSTASAPTDADDAAANALLDQGRSALKQRLNGAGQDAREQLNNAEHEYQHNSDQIDAARTQALVGTVLPGLIEGSVKGVVAAPSAITAVPAPPPPAPLLPINAAPGRSGLISSIRRTVRPATRMWSPRRPESTVRRPAQPPSDRELM